MVSFVSYGDSVKEIPELPYQLMDMLSDAVAVLDKNSVVTYANNALICLFVKQ